VIALAAVPAAAAHGTLSPVTASAGSTQTFDLTVPADRLDADITGVALRVPEGVSIESAEARQPLWAVAWDDEGVSWQGGPIDRGGAETFRFTARMPGEPGAAELTLVETYDDGEAAPFPIAVTVTGGEGGGSDDTIAVAALVAALLALGVATAALAVALRGRRRLHSRA
jgi:uncharacterized protein YcnI